MDNRGESNIVKKVISFCLYGNNPKYVTGMQKNAKLAKVIFPDWEVWVYHYDVDKELLAPLNPLGARLINMTGNKLPGMFWRFLPNVDTFIVRDADSRLSLREELAVDEWMASGKGFHVMKDHPHHNQTIMGGMFGIKPREYDIEAKAIEWCKLDGIYGSVHVHNADQRFLREVIYPDFCNDMMVHESIGPTILGSLPFPSKMIDRRFVGEIYDENDNRDFQYKLLID